MKLVKSNGYVIAEIERNLFVVDTGSPVSFNYIGLERLTIDGRSYTIDAPVLCPKEKADSITGVNLAGFIGMDILGKTNLTIDHENEELLFGIKDNVKPGPDFYFLPFNYLMGSYIVTDNILLNDEPIGKALIDTGAPISFVSESIAKRLEKADEHYEQDSGMFGVLTGEYRKGSMRFNSMAAAKYNVPVKVGVVSGLLRAVAPVDAVIGADLLSEKCIIFDFHNMRIGVALDERSKGLDCEAFLKKYGQCKLDK